MGCGLCDRGLFRASFAGYKDADAFDHLGGGGGSLGEEDVGADGAVEGVDGSGDDHGGEAGVELLGASDELVAVHLGHDEVAEEEIDATGDGAFDVFEGLAGALSGNYAVAAGFEEECAYGEDLFVVIDTEDGFLWAQSILVFCREKP